MLKFDSQFLTFFYQVMFQLAWQKGCSIECKSLDRAYTKIFELLRALKDIFLVVISIMRRGVRFLKHNSFNIKTWFLKGGFEKDSKVWKFLGKGVRFQAFKLCSLKPD